MRKIYHLYADFETLVTNQPEVYSWAVGHNKKDTITTGKKVGETGTIDKRGMTAAYGIGINSFLDYIQTIDKDTQMWFNNLRGFDGHFILPALDAYGYSQKPEFPEDIYNMADGWQTDLFWNRFKTLEGKLWDEDPKFKLRTKKEQFKQIKRNWGLLLPYEYSVLANKSHQIMEIKIGLESQKRTNGIKKYRALSIRDNLSLFPTSIKQAGKLLAEAEVKNGMTAKEAADTYLKKELENGYTKEDKYNSLSELENDGNELDYLIQDIYILYKYHYHMNKYFPSKDWKLTIASTSYNQWINEFGSDLIQSGLENKSITTVKQKKGGTLYKVLGKDTKYSKDKLANHLITKILPTKWLDEETKTGATYFQELYTYYRGGISKVNEKYRGQLVKNVTFLDINSSYPSAMVMEAIKVPYGELFEGKQKGTDYFYYKLTPKRDIENKHGLPFLFADGKKKREYTKVLKKGQEYKFTTVLKPDVEKYYLKGVNKTDYKLVVEYSAYSMPIKLFFNSYINKWYKIKEDASKAGNKLLKNIAKLFMNSLYGKYGTKDLRVSKIWNSIDGLWENKEEEVEAKYYLPIAISIVEIAISNLVNGVGKNYEDFVYCDTDSIAITNFKKENHPELELNPSKLGAWDIEFSEGYGVFRRSKQYLLRNATSSKIAFAGINFATYLLPKEDLKLHNEITDYYKNVTLIDFVQGKTITEQKSPEIILGYGKMIENIDKEIKPVWAYKNDEISSEQKYYKFEHFEQTLKELQTMKHEDIVYNKIQEDDEKWLQNLENIN